MAIRVSAEEPEGGGEANSLGDITRFAFVKLKFIRAL